MKFEVFYVYKHSGFSTFKILTNTVMTTLLLLNSLRSLSLLFQATKKSQAQWLKYVNLRSVMSQPVAGMPVNVMLIVMARDHLW